MSARKLNWRAASSRRRAQAWRIAVRFTTMVSSSRSNLAASTAAASQASSRASGGRSFSCSRSVMAGASGMELHSAPFRLVPVQYALFPDVVKPGQKDEDVHQHLEEAEHLQLVEDH